MTRAEKIQQLRKILSEQLAGRIDRDYVLMGLPYYLNVGDILIWEGTRQFLAATGRTCLNAGYRYREEDRIRDDTLILLQGGGNFGDLWRWVQEERLDILRRHPDNPALIFPVSCWYEDPALLRQDAARLAGHPNLTICARDSASFELLVQNFRNRILLVPDMAFFIDPAPLRKRVASRSRGALYVKRTDKELAESRGGLPAAPPDGLTVADWPSMETAPWHWTLYNHLLKWGRNARRKRGVWRVADPVVKLSDWFYHQISRRLLIQQGVAFIGRHRTIYTTRLHAAILAILLDKDVQILDNSFGKISGYCQTWLGDVDGVRLLN
jgi:pyruvyl transferase EpsO